MMNRFASCIVLFLFPTICIAADAMEQTLQNAGTNRAELERAWKDCPEAMRPGMKFLLMHMPERDAKQLKAAYLLENVQLAYQARKELPWGKSIPEELFFNDVLAYANVDETRDAWRKEFYELCLPMVKDCKTASEAVQKLNMELYKKLKVVYSTQRNKPNQSAKESIGQGKASCTGLSIILSNACRSVCIPARLVGTPNWVNKSGNHTWVEIWDGKWHFTGACEADPKGLDRGWFTDRAAQAKADDPEHAIYAASFAKTKTHFPLVWAPKETIVSGVNVTDHYAKEKKPTPFAQVRVRVIGAKSGERIALPIEVLKKGSTASPILATSRGPTADLNDVLTLHLTDAETDFIIKCAGQTLELRSPKFGAESEIVIKIPGK